MEELTAYSLKLRKNVVIRNPKLVDAEERASSRSRRGR